MSLTLKNVEGAYSAGKTKWDQWFSKQEEEWYRPWIKTQLAVFLKSIPPEVKERNAQTIKNLEETIGVDQLHGGNENAEIKNVLQWKPSPDGNAVQPTPTPGQFGKP